MSTWFNQMAELRAAFTEYPEPGVQAVRSYLLVDPATLTRLKIQPPLHDEALCVSIADEERVAVPTAKPFIVWLDGDEDHAQSVLTWWGDRFAHGTCLSLLQSRLALHPFARALRARTDIELEGGLVAWLRIADTRVMPVAWEVMTEAQRRVLGADVLHWAYTDRDGQWRSLVMPLDVTSAQDIPETRIRLTQQQEDALMDSAQIDHVMQRLGSEYRALSQSWSHSRRWAWVKHIAEGASQDGPKPFKALVEYCNKAASEGLQCHLTGDEMNNDKYTASRA